MDWQEREDKFRMEQEKNSWRIIRKKKNTQTPKETEHDYEIKNEKELTFKLITTLFEIFC